MDQRFTYIWKIENISFCCDEDEMVYELNSPEFEIRALKKTRWYLAIKPWREEGINVYLCRSNDEGPKTCIVNYEFSLLRADGSYYSKEYRRFFKKGGCWGASILGKRNDVLNSAVSPQNTLTVSCLFQNSYWKPKQTQVCIARTHMTILKNVFIWTIGNFCSFPSNAGKRYIVQSPATENTLLTMEIIPSYSDDEFEGEIALNIEPNNSRIPYIAEVELSSIGKQGLYVDIWKGNVKFLTPDDIWDFVLEGKKTQLLAEENQYLLNNVLTLRCECIVSDGIGSSCIEEVVNGSSTLHNNFDEFHKKKSIADEKNSENDKLDVTDLDQSRAKILLLSDSGTQTTITETQTLEKRIFQTPELHDLTFKNDSCESLAADFHKLFLDRSFADVKIRVEKEVISVHRAVLSARSSVFNAMLTSDMREASANVIEIEDLDSDTVHRMLHYMYTDSVDDLLWGPAMNLYIAADKYDIGTLKKRCSSLLSSNIRINNVCQVLSLANSLADEKLSETSRNFIYSMDTKIIGTSEWANFMKRDALLAAEIMEWMYIKKAGRG